MPRRRPRRWLTRGIPLVLAALVAVALVAYFVVSDREQDTAPAGATAEATTSAPAPPAAPPSAATAPPTTPAPPPGPPAPASPTGDVAGAWVGSGTLTGCEGFSDSCLITLPFAMSIDCARTPCLVMPLEGFAWAPLNLTRAEWQASGSVPPQVAPTCNGEPNNQTRWSLLFSAVNGTLVGSYTEITPANFPCTGTRVVWEFTLTRA